MAHGNSDDDAVIQLPNTIFGDNPQGLIKYLGLQGKQAGEDLWAVRTTRKADLISVYNLADASGRAHSFDLLDKHVPNSEPLTDPHLIARFHALSDELKRRAANGDDLAARLHQIQLNVVTADLTDLAAIVAEAYGEIGRFSLGTAEESLFTSRSVHLIRVSDLLIRRARLPGVMFRFAQDPDAGKLLTKALEDKTRTDLCFASSASWFFELIGAARYLGPLLGCISPRFWCVPSNRALSVILFNLGTDITGYRRAPMEPMQLLPSKGPEERAPAITLHSSSGVDAIDWWAMRLNQMFGYLSDPGTFKDSEGFYSPNEHHHWMLTIDRCFSLTTSIQLASRDKTVQQALMNDLLDTFDGRQLLDVDFHRLCTWSYAKKRADAVRQRMPARVAALLMPAADRAVAALQQVQDGFFIQQQRSDTEVVLRMPNGETEQRSPERAAAMLLKLYRNAIHGFGGRGGRGSNPELDAALLVHHTGKFPDDLALLPYLYLLDLLCHPENIRASIARKVARSS